MKGSKGKLNRRISDINDRPENEANGNKNNPRRRLGGAHADPGKGSGRAERHAVPARYARRSADDAGQRPEPRPHKQNFIARVVNQWFDRVVGAMKGDGLSEAEAIYAPHRTTRDFVWNSIGSGAWAMVFPVVTMVSTQLVGVEQAGMISMAFVVGLLLMFLGNFGVRTYQVSDTKMEHSFKDYQANRWVTCILMLLVGWVYCSIRGYSDEMFNISMAVILYKFIDALADVYEGRLQQVDKLYLAGISQTLRSVAALVVFSVALLISHNAVVACYAMAIVAAATFVVFTWPLTLMEAPPSSPFSFPSFLELFKVCAPLFLALFLFNVIENMPKFVMEGALPYDNQLYYNAIYFPAQMILIASQLVYKPLLLRMAGVWQDASKRMKFNMLLVGIFAVIAVITAIACGIMAWIGIPVMNFLYGIDFKQFRGLLFLMLITGGITAAIDFIYQVITIMRRQKDVTVLYLVTFGFSLFIPYLLVHYAELEGAVLSYVIIESILFVLLVWEYFRIRRDLARGVGRYAQEQGAGLAENAGAHGHAPAGEHRPTYRDGVHDGEGHSPDRPTFLELMDPADAGIDDDEILEEVEEPPARPLPSEIRAERERRAEIMRRRTGKDR